MVKDPPPSPVPVLARDPQPFGIGGRFLLDLDLVREAGYINLGQYPLDGESLNL